MKKIEQYKQSNQKDLGTLDAPYSIHQINSFSEMEWKGGYVETIGYISSSEEDYLSIFDDWWKSIISSVYNVYHSVASWLDDLSESPYVIAVKNYASDNVVDITLDVSKLGLNHIRKEILMHKSGNQYGVNLVNLDTLRKILSWSPSNEWATIVSTALALGNITFEHISGNRYRILDDRYDFEMHEWKKEMGRNIATILGAIVNDFSSITYNAINSGLLGSLSKFKDRMCQGGESFVIHFQGELVIKD